MSGQLNVSVDNTTDTSITLSWSVPNGPVVTSYEMMWTSDECPDDVDEGNATTTETSYIIEDLREGTNYTITVNATNLTGTSFSDCVKAETKELGNSINVQWIVNLHCALCISFPVPSAPPTSVSVSAVTSSSITVQWGAVDCIHHNGDITGYSVQYGEVGSGSTQTMNVSGDNVTEATVSNLMSSTTYLMLSTTYSIQVAAENSVGTGVYSDTVFATPDSKTYVDCHTCFTRISTAYMV